MKRVIVLILSCLAMVILLSGAGTAQAQQLEPRAYSPAPIGLNFLGIGTLYTSGGVVTDPSLPIQNVHARVYNAVPYYGRTFGLVVRLATVRVTVPFAVAKVVGDVCVVTRNVECPGVLDPQVRFA